MRRSSGGRWSSDAAEASHARFARSRKRREGRSGARGRASVGVRSTSARAAWGGGGPGGNWSPAYLWARPTRFPFLWQQPTHEPQCRAQNCHSFGMRSGSTVWVKSPPPGVQLSKGGRCDGLPKLCRVRNEQNPTEAGPQEQIVIASLPLSLGLGGHCIAPSHHGWLRAQWARLNQQRNPVLRCCGAGDGGWHGPGEETKDQSTKWRMMQVWYLGGRIRT